MKKLCVLIIFGLIVFSCRKDIDEFSRETDIPPPLVLVKKEVKGQVMGVDGQGLQGALVKLAGMTTITSSGGRFDFGLIQVPKARTNIQVELPGYFSSAKTIDNEIGGSSYTSIRLIEKDAPKAFMANQDNNITGDDEVLYKITANTLVTTSGNSYNGEANLYSTWFDPTSSDLGATMPGDLVTVDDDGNTYALMTYGMINVQLETINGQPLTVAEGESIEVEMPVPQGLDVTEGEEIPIWYYDLEESQWLREGFCKVRSGKCVFTITKPGIYNVDKDVEAICLSGTVFDADSTVTPYLQVTVEDLTDNFVYWGYTNSEGFFCGSVPRGAELLITITDHCNNVIYSENIGPFSEDFTLDPIYLESNVSQFLVNIIGDLRTCINPSPTPARGHISIRYPGHLRVHPFEGGDLDTTIAFNCFNFPEIEIIAYDLENGLQSDAQIYTEFEDIDLGQLILCNEFNDSLFLQIDTQLIVASPTEYSFKPNETTDWLVMEATTAAGIITLELRDYTGIGNYTTNAFLKTENFEPIPEYLEINTASPRIEVEISADDGSFIEGTIQGNALNMEGAQVNVSGQFRIQKTPE